MKKYLSLLKYIIIHKVHVFIGLAKLGLWKQAFFHDLSKFRPDEFFPYAERFYGTGKNKKEFQKAVFLHHSRNPHHWEYWVTSINGNDTLERKIPLKYLYEMYVDWTSANKLNKMKISVKEWYLMNKNKIRMNKESQNELMMIIEGTL